LRTVNIFGATGSIGQNTLNVLKYQSNKESFKVIALSANNNVEVLSKSAKEVGADYAIVANSEKYLELKESLFGSSVIPMAGPKSIIEASQIGVDWTMNAIVGFAGLQPSLATAQSGSVLALANKESLVCGGKLLTSIVKKYDSFLLPVDSEHSAIFQCLKNENANSIDKVILTASGGPFRKYSLKEMRTVTLEEAVIHPNWSMGVRISIDSATMFNKALEVIETKYLFNINSSDIEVLIHPESIVHSMVSFVDGSVIAQLSIPDMKGAIGYALNHPFRLPLGVERLNLTKIKSLKFEKVDVSKFRALHLAYEVLKRGELFGAVLNASKEVALDKFINGEISFLDITVLVEKVLDSSKVVQLENIKGDNINDILFADSLARQIANSIKLS